MNKERNKIWFSVTVVFAICLAISVLSYFVTAPGHIMPALYGDGTKNFFTYLYHCIYGKGTWFEGMNYPYGEHIVYADGQPLLSTIFASFNHVSIGMALSALWLFIGLSYILSVVYNYKILVHFKVSPPAAMIFAGLICIFSPQVFRLGGQYSLSYMCIIPMLFYWTIQYHHRILLKYCVYIFLLGCVASFLHPYFAGIVMLWVLSYVAGYFIFTREKLRRKIKHILPVLISMICVAAVVAIVMSATDPVKDRPVNPEGTLFYTTRLSDLGYSEFSPVWSYVTKHKLFGNLFSGIEMSEGYAYLGLVVIVAFIFSLLAGIYRKLKKTGGDIIVGENGFSPVWLFMAFSTLLLSMGVPFIWHMAWLLDYISILRQFRTLGRFSWICYYIISVYGVIVIYNVYVLLISRRRFIIAYTILISAIILWIIEATGYIKYTRDLALTARNNYDDFFSTPGNNWESAVKSAHLAKNDFQAILILSFYHEGSEKLWVGDPGLRMTFAAEAAIQLHLPIVDVMMSRTSLSQTEKQVKIAAGPYAEKPMLHDIKSNKPFLLLTYDHDHLDPDQKYLLQATDYLGHFSNCNLYAFYPARQLANDKKNADSISAITPFMAGHDTCVVNKGDWYVNRFDNGNAPNHLFGSGAMLPVSGSDSVIALIPLRPATDSQEYEFSCWFLLNANDHASPDVLLESLDSAGHVIASALASTRSSVDNEGLWFRTSAYFLPGANCRKLRCTLSKGNTSCYKGMDEILLRPADALIISKAPNGSIMVNNHLLHLVYSGKWP